MGRWKSIYPSGRRWRFLTGAILLALLSPDGALPGAIAAVVAEGTYTVIAPEKRTIPFRMVLTERGARIVPAEGETLAFSYAEKAALVLNGADKSYFLLPLDLVPPLLAEGFGYDSRALGAMASGSKKKLLGVTCAEVVVSGSSPKLTLRAWRTADPAWSREYALFERSLHLPWTTANPPAVFLGIPLAGSIEIQSRHPYKASWEIKELTRDESAAEEFIVPAGYQMDLERLLSLQGGKPRKN